MRSFFQSFRNGINESRGKLLCGEEHSREASGFYQGCTPFGQIGLLNTSVEPVVAEADKPYAIRHEDLPEIFAQYEALAKV